jgi:cytochrome c5
MLKHEQAMKHGLIARLLIATSLTILLPVAIANTEPQPKEPSNELVQPEQTEPNPKSEPKPVLPATGSRGQMLYENHCQDCHTSVVHVREMRRVHSVNDLEHWVKRWAETLKLSWGKDEINDVVNYLNQQYYKVK